MDFLYTLFAHYIGHKTMNMNAVTNTNRRISCRRCLCLACKICSVFLLHSFTTLHFLQFHVISVITHRVSCLLLVKQRNTHCDLSACFVWDQWLGKPPEQTRNPKSNKYCWMNTKLTWEALGFDINSHLDTSESPTSHFCRNPRGGVLIGSSALGRDYASLLPWKRPSRTYIIGTHARQQTPV